MTPAAWLLCAIVIWCLICLASIGARVLSDFSVHELEQYCQLRQQPARFARIMEQHDRLAVTPLTLAVLAVVAFCACFVASLRDVPLLSSPGIGWLAAGLMALLAATVWLPLAVGRHWSAPLVYHTWSFWSAMNLALFPILVCGQMIDGLVARLAGTSTTPDDEEEAFEEEIRSMVKAGLHDGLLDTDAREMIEGVIELGDADVEDIMTPRSQVDALPVEASWPELLQFLNHVRRTRIPVYEQENLDQIVGLLYTKDLLPELAREETQRKPLREIVRDAWFVPATKPVDELLREFQQTRKHLAIVRDEFRSVAGVVTIEDALEEIVGEIVDEYDVEEEEEFTRIDEQTIEVLGRTHIDDINERLGLALPESEEYDTIGGLITRQLQRIPHVGDRCQFEHVNIVVLAASKRLVERVRLELVIAGTDDSTATAGSVL